MERQTCLDVMKDVQFFCKKKLSSQVTTSMSIIHDINLESKCLKVQGIHIILDSLKQIGKFYKYLECFSNIHQNENFWFEDCVEQYKAALLQNKRLPEKSLRCLMKIDLCKKHCTWRLSKDVWATPIMSWKHFINRWSGGQQYYSGIGTFKINNKLRFHHWFSHNEIFLWFYPQIKLDIARFWVWYP